MSETLIWDLVFYLLKYSANKNKQVEIYRIFDTYDTVTYAQLINFHAHIVCRYKEQNDICISTHVESCIHVALFLFSQKLPIPHRLE